MFAKMMGGLSYDSVLGNLRKSIRLSNGSRLKIQANLSITKANQDRISRIGKMLEEEGVGPVTYSLCHSRGGNLQDKSVCDTPPMPVERWTCDVMKNTLFVDWRGMAFILRPRHSRRIRTGRFDGRTPGNHSGASPEAA